MAKKNTTGVDDQILSKEPTAGLSVDRAFRNLAHVLIEIARTGSTEWVDPSDSDDPSSI